MRARVILAVWRKELTEVVRDRRALVSTLLIPTVVMPLLMFGFGAIAAKITSKALSEKAPIVVLGAENSPALIKSLEASPKLVLKSFQADWRTAVADKKVRAVLEIPADFDSLVRSAAECPPLKIYHYEGEMRSGIARGEIRQILADYREHLVEERLKERKLSATLIKPYDIKSENVAPPEKVGGNAIGGIIPYVFILFCLTGALYPAIDLTAGEKERGTLETVLSSPVSRLELSLGKLLTVLTASLTTVFCSLLSMGLSFMVVGVLLADKFKSVGMGQVMGGGPGGAGLSIAPAGLAVILLLALPLALFFSALLLAIALNARSTKEAQSTCSPLIVITILPAMMGMMPGVELNALFSLVPILNLALVSKELLSGVWHWQYIGLTFVSCLVYASIAVAFCAWQFNREKVVFRT